MFDIVCLDVAPLPLVRLIVIACFNHKFSLSNLFNFREIVGEADT